MKIKKTKFLSLGQIRKYHHKQQILKLRSMGIPLNFFKSPYTYLKSMYAIETSAILVFLLQNTKVTPNSITWIFVSLGLLSGLFLASNNDTLIFIGLIILFTNSTFDWADGLLARIKNKTSNLGDLLDTWGGLVCVYSYLLGFGIYHIGLVQIFQQIKHWPLKDRTILLYLLQQLLLDLIPFLKFYLLVQV